MGANKANFLVISEFECKNRSTPTALAHGAQIMHDPRVQVLIYGKGYARAHGPDALMFVVYERGPGVAGAPPILVATAAYDVGGVAMSARSKRQWEGGVQQGAAATDPFLPPFQADLWQRVVPTVVQAAVVEVDGWTTAGGAVVVPAKAAQGQPGLVRQPGFCARVAAHAGVGIAHISSATLQSGVAMIHRDRICTKDLYVDLLRVAERYIDAPR